MKERRNGARMKEREREKEREKERGMRDAGVSVSEAGPTLLESMRANERRCTGACGPGPIIIHLQGLIQRG